VIGIEKQLMHTEFLQREYAVKHAPYKKEMAFNNSIVSGDMERVGILMTPLVSIGYGVISAAPAPTDRYLLFIDSGANYSCRLPVWVWSDGIWPLRNLILVYFVCTAIPALKSN